MIEWTSRYLNNLTGNDKITTVDLLDKATTRKSEGTENSTGVTPFVYQKWKSYGERPPFPQFLDFLGISGVLGKGTLRLERGHITYMKD